VAFLFPDNAWVWLVPPLALIAIAFLAWWWIEYHARTCSRIAERIFSEVFEGRAAHWLRVRFPSLRRFIGARLSPGRYLGLHLTLGLILTGLAIAAFLEIADNVADKNNLASFDVATIEWLHARAQPSGVAIAEVVTFLGSAAGLTILAVVVAGFLAARKYRIMLIGWVAALVGGGILDEALKLVFRRPRPTWALPLVVYPTWSWSFPSGHATEAVVAFGMLGYLCIVESSRRRGVSIAIAFATFVLICAIGFSRLYLGVHYPTDVVGGFAIGLCWLSVCVTGLEVARGYHRSR